MNQSFNKDNFIKIFYNENRKGNYVEGRFDIFNPLRKYTKQLEVLKSKFKKGLYKNTEIKIKANKVRKNIKKHRNRILEKILLVIEKEIKNNPPHITLTNIVIKGKTTYSVDRTNPYIFFMIKQLQKNISSIFRVKQANRHEIISQVSILLEDNFPKFLIRTDIENFYETIPHKVLSNKINSNRYISSQSIKLINSILNEYINLSSGQKGIPRGIGISAYLAELYLQDIDDQIRAMPNLLYYARYVDDLILIFTPNTTYETINYEEKVTKIIEISGLEVNTLKTKPWNGISNKNREFNIDFLGYNMHKNPSIPRITLKDGSLDESYLHKMVPKIQTAQKYYYDYCREPQIPHYVSSVIGNRELADIKKMMKFYNEFNKKLKLRFTEKKFQRYKKKIKLAIDEYNTSSKFDEKTARALLINRFKYLTSNTRLLNAKNNVLIGIYFSNSHLNDYKCLRDLDDFLKQSVKNLIQPYSKLTHIDKVKLQEKLQEFSFLSGFMNITFRVFTTEKIKHILRVWKAI